MKKKCMGQLMAAVLILCTLISANLLPKIDDSLPEKAILAAECSIQNVGGNSIANPDVLCTENARLSGKILIFSETVSCRTEKKSKFISYTVMAVLFKTAVYTCLILSFLLAFAGYKKTVRMKILSIVHRKDGKKRVAIFI